MEFKTAWELANKMPEELKPIFNMSNEDKIARCKTCAEFSDLTLSGKYCEPCSSCICNPKQFTCTAIDFYHYDWGAQL